MRFILIALSFVLLVCLSQGQRFCTSCFQANYTDFLCNGDNCQAFYWPSSYISSSSGLVCKGTSSTGCYYNDGLDYSSSLYRFIACNYTIGSCSTCNNRFSCENCYKGFLTYYTNVENEYSTCRKCSDAIPGCQMCGKASSCDQCETQYLSMGGFCYQNDGKTIAGTSSQISVQVGIEAGVIIIAIFSAFSFLVIGYAVRIWIKKQRYEPLMQQNR